MRISTMFGGPRKGNSKVLCQGQVSLDIVGGGYVELPYRIGRSVKQDGTKNNWIFVDPQATYTRKGTKEKLRSFMSPAVDAIGHAQALKTVLEQRTELLNHRVEGFRVHWDITKKGLVELSREQASAASVSFDEATEKAINQETEDLVWEDPAMTAAKKTLTQNDKEFDS